MTGNEIFEKASVFASSGATFAWVLGNLIIYLASIETGVSCNAKTATLGEGGNQNCTAQLITYEV
jgi:hypothetical protein